MRKLFSVICFAIIFLLIGRNLMFLPRFELLTNKKNETERVKNDISQLIKKQKGNYSVYYHSLTADLSFGINENQVHTAASVNKIPIIAALYHLANNGTINLNEQVTLQKEDIQDYGTGSLRYQKPGTPFALKTLVKLSLQQSDNTAAYILSQKIGMDTIQKTINAWGLSQTDMEENTSSVFDMYLLFRRFYKREITNEALSQELLGFMKDTDYEDRLSTQLPSGSVVYHKTGDGQGIVHDVGIVQNGNIVFFVGVFASDIGDKEKETKETIGQIAKKLLDFEKSLK